VSLWSYLSGLVRNKSTMSGVVPISKPVQRDALFMQTLKLPGSGLDPAVDGLVTDGRVFCQWQKHETAPGVFDFDSPMYDKAHAYYSNPFLQCDLQASRGRANILMFRDAGFAQRPSFYSADNHAAFANAAAKAVKRAGAGAFAVGFVNEFSSLIQGVEVGDIPWLATRYGMAYAAVKAANPSILVVGFDNESIAKGGNGVASTLAILAAAGKSKIIDRLSLHGYVHGPAFQASDGTMVQEPIALLDQFDYAIPLLRTAWAGEIWQTEAGMFPKGDHRLDTFTQAEQLRWVSQLGRIARLKGCTVSNVYGFNEVNNGIQSSPFKASLIQRFRDLQALDSKTHAATPYTTIGLAITEHFADGSSYSY
jgi:hypothetical protein